MEMINKAIFSMLIMGSASFSVFGMHDSTMEDSVPVAAVERAVQEAGSNLLDMPVYQLRQIFSQCIQDFGLNHYEELKEACKGLCRLRKVCKALRDFLTPLEIANILKSRALGVGAANESLLDKAMLKHDPEMKTILIWTIPVEKRAPFLMRRIYYDSSILKVLQCCGPETTRQLLMAVPEEERTAVVMATDCHGHNTLQDIVFHEPLWENNEDYKKNYAEKARVLIDLLPVEQRAAVLVAKNRMWADQIKPEGYTALDIAAERVDVKLGRVLLELYQSLGIEVPHDEATTYLITKVGEAIQMDKARNEMREIVKRYPAVALTPCCESLILKSDLEWHRKREDSCPICMQWLDCKKVLP